MIDQEKYVKVIADPLEKQQPVAEAVNNVDAEFTENGTYSAPAPYTGYGIVTVNVPTGTESKTITENGTYTPTSPNIGFNSVTVNVPNQTYNTTIGQNGTFYPGTGYIGFSRVTVNVPDKTFLGQTVNQINGTVENGVIQRGTVGTVDFTGVTEIAQYGLYYTFYYKNTSGDIILPSVTTIGTFGMYCTFYANTNGIESFVANSLTSVGSYGLYYAFGYGSLRSASMNGLITVSSNNALEYMFRASQLETLNLPNLETISGANALDGICRSCSNLATINMPKLKEIVGTSGFQYAFYATKITTYTFSALDTLTGSNALARTFGSNTSLESLYFPKLKSTSFGTYTNQFYLMLTGCTNVTVHFPSNLQSVIGSWADVQAGFGGTNTTVLFDLTATE